MRIDKSGKSFFLLFGVFLFLINISFGQKTTFQKLYKRDFHNQALDITPLKDGGYAYVGIVDTTNSSAVMLTKIDCEGKLEWSKKFGASSTIGNISPGVIDTKEGDIVFTFNVGSFNNYDIIVVRIGYDGTVKWKKRLEAAGNNMGQAIVQTLDNGFVVAGASGAYGTDVGNSWDDVYLVKFDGNGVVQWSKTYGNNGNYDEAFAIAEDAAGNLLTTGRYIFGGTFYAFILKTDASGNFKFLRGYGAPNHRTNAYGIIVTKDQKNYLITGFTTINKTFFNDYSDVFLVKTDTSGTPVFTKIYYPYVGSDNSDIGSSVVETASGGYAVGVATSSFSNHSVGFVPNKNAVFIVRSDGSLLQGKLYNQGSSHYTKLKTALDGGYILSNFTNFGIAAQYFTPLIIKTDENLLSGCNEIDVTNEIETQSDGWESPNAPYTSKKGDNFINFSQESYGSYTTIETYCEDIPVLEANINPVTNGCVGQPINFNTTSKGSIIRWVWNFGDQNVVEGDSSVSHTYQSPGTFTITLVASNGCNDITSTIQVIITPPVITNQNIEICQGDSIEVNGRFIKDAGTYQDTLAGSMCDSIVITTVNVNPLEQITLDSVLCSGDSILLGNRIVKEAGIYLDTIAGQPCRKIYTYNITAKTCKCELIIPNVFTPNGDGRNDFLAPFVDCGNNITAFSLQIYNRWGKVVFESDNPKLKWDGTYNDKPAPSDVYVYVLNYDTNIDGVKQNNSSKGDITLVR